MKKGIFTIMNYLMPKQGVLSMHCSANEGPHGDVVAVLRSVGHRQDDSLGRSARGADRRRRALLERRWRVQHRGGLLRQVHSIFRPRTEPEIFQAIRFGTVLENVVYDDDTRQVDFDDDSLTENTRGGYPIEFIPQRQDSLRRRASDERHLAHLRRFWRVAPCEPAHARPSHVSLYQRLHGQGGRHRNRRHRAAGDVFGLLRRGFSGLAPDEVRRDAGRARCSGIDARRLAGEHRLDRGAYGVGSRIKLSYTRAIIDAIHQWVLANVPMVEEPMFGLMVPRHCPGVPDNILLPELSWNDKAAYGETARHLAHLFHEHFELYRGAASAEVIVAADRHGAGVTCECAAIRR